MSSIRNYRPMAKNKLIEFMEKYPDYSIGQIIYSGLHHLESGINSKADIKNVSDEELYEAFDRAIAEETTEETPEKW